MSLEPILDCGQIVLETGDYISAVVGNVESSSELSNM